MQILAKVHHRDASYDVSVSTDGRVQPLSVPARASGRGSSVNGGELLMLALATCYCNDLYREAQRLAIPLDEVEVEAQAEFGGIGLAATNIRYRARLRSAASDEALERLRRETDAVAEIHNTVRAGVPVTLETWID